MRRIIWLLIIIFLLAALFYFWYGGEAPAHTEGGSVENTVLALLEGTQFVVPNGDGLILSIEKRELATGDAAFVAESEDPATRTSATFPVENGIHIVEAGGEGEGESVRWVLMPFYVNENEREGTFLYAGLFSLIEDELTHSDSLFIGDKVLLTDIHSSDTPNTFSLQYLDRADKEASPAIPTMSASVLFGREGPRLVQLGRLFNATAEDIVIHSPLPQDEKEQLFIVEGEARGYWFFEGSFSVEVADGSGRVLATAIALTKEDPETGARADWMTEALVPFQAQVELEDYEGDVTLVLHRDNPSDMRELDAFVSIPLTIISQTEEQ